MKQKTQVIIWGLVIVIIVGLFAWFIISLVDVNLHNAVSSSGQRLAWNLFSVAEKMRAVK